MVPYKPETDSVPSPCIDVCQIDGASGFCRGCYRTLDEISFWVDMTSAQKRTVLNELTARREAGDRQNLTP